LIDEHDAIVLGRILYDGTPAATLGDGLPVDANHEPGDTTTAASAEPDDGGQTGGIGADNVTYTSLRLDEVGPSGFTPAEAIAAFSGEAHAELVYESGERTTVSFQITANGEDVDRATDFATGPYLFESWETYVQSNHLILGIDVQFATADGKFEETFVTELWVQSLAAARLYFELAPSALQGSYVPPFDAEAAGEEASSAARVRVLAELERPGVELQTSGELFGSFPTPELLPEVDFSDSRLAHW